jgi:hypothetical protein
MAAFDVEGYRKAAKAAGISDSEIENEIKFQTSDPAKTDPFKKGPDGFQLGTAEQIQERIGNDWWHLPAGLAVLGAAATGLKALMGGGADDPNDPSNRPTYRFDPKLDVEPIDQQPMQPVKPQQTNLTPQDLEARAAQLKAPVAPSATPTVAELDAAFAAQNPISTPITAAPVDAPAPTPSAAPNSPVTSIVTDTVKEMIQEIPEQPIEAAKPPAAAPAPVAPPQELRTGTGKPAFAGMGPAAELNKKGMPKFKNEYASVADVPSGYAFVPGAQYIDTPRQNIGQAEYTKAYTERPFPLTNEQAIQESKDINRLLGRATRAEMVAAGLAPAEITRGITQPINQPKGSGMGTKTTRVAGTIGALVAIPNLANAAQQGNYGGAALQAADIATDYLPFVGQIKQALSPSSAGEGSTLSPEQVRFQENSMLLGSPYAQTELAKKRRQALEYAAKVGGGRGLTPASAYQR